jgi:pyrroline-5-carboxylate reductase
MLAGIKIQAIKTAVGTNAPCVVRIMPNLACEFGEGVTLVATSGLPTERSKEIMALLNPLGLTVELDEEMFNAGTAVSGCGPAFFYSFFNAFVKAGETIGLDAALVRDLVLQTAKGAAVSAQKTNLPLFDMTERVCSKGGATVEGVKVLERHNIAEIMQETVLASKNRSDELENLA